MKYRRNLRVLVLLVLITAIGICGCQSGNSNIIDNSFKYSYNSLDRSYNTPLSRVDTFADDICVIYSEQVNADNPRLIHAQSGLLINRNTGNAIYTKSPFVRMYPASTTKILTSLIALEEGDYDAELSVGEEVNLDEENITLCDFRVGDQISFDIAIHGAILASGNDAAAYLTRFAYEDMDQFIARMNERATELGATKSHFMNPHGLHHTSHYSTAYDLYLIFNEACKNKKFREYIHTVEYESSFIRTTIYNTYTIPVSFESTNMYLSGNRDVPEGAEIIGGKSGTTFDYQYNYCLLFTVKGVEYIAIVLGDDNRNLLYDDLDALIELAIEYTELSGPTTDIEENFENSIPEEITTEYQYSDQG